MFVDCTQQTKMCSVNKIMNIFRIILSHNLRLNMRIDWNWWHIFEKYICINKMLLFFWKKKQQKTKEKKSEQRISVMNWGKCPRTWYAFDASCFKDHHWWRSLDGVEKESGWILTIFTAGECNVTGGDRHNLRRHLKEH